jgi:hypothetical protein
VQLTAIETGYPGFDAFRIGKRPEIDYHAWSEAIGVEAARIIHTGSPRGAAELTDELYR